MPTTPIYGLRYPSATDPADVPIDMQELATDVETKLKTVADRVTALETTAAGFVIAGFDSQRVTGTSRADGSLVVVATDVSIFATGFTFVANQWRCDVPGEYILYCSFGWLASGTGSRYVLIRKNNVNTGISDQRPAAVSSRFTYMGAVGFQRLLAGDVLDLQARQDSGSGLGEATDGSIRLGAWRLGS